MSHKNPPRTDDSSSLILTRPERPKKTWWDRFRRFWEDVRSQLSSDPLERCRWRNHESNRESVSGKVKDQLGRAGEEEAVFYLEENGYRILQRNTLLRNGEIDIIARIERTLVFFEVKTRRSGEFGEPFEAVRDRKRKRMVGLANHFLSLHRLRGIPIRFDLLDIVWPEDEPPRLTHHVEAFRADDLYR